MPRVLSPDTVRRELVTLQAAITHCVKSGYLVNPPVVTLLPKGDARDRWLTRGEVAKLVQAARRIKRVSKRLAMFILFQCYHGSRRGASHALMWHPNETGGWIDLDRGWVDFVGETMQTSKRRIKVPLNHRMQLLLRAYRRKTNGKYVFEYQGAPIDNPNRALQQAATAAGLGKVTSHTRRHTCITWLVQDGVPLWEVSQWAGTSIEMIQKHYGHHAPDRFQNVQRAQR